MLDPCAVQTLVTHYAALVSLCGTHLAGVGLRTQPYSRNSDGSFPILFLTLFQRCIASILSGFALFISLDHSNIDSAPFTSDSLAQGFATGTIDSPSLSSFVLESLWSKSLAKHSLPFIIAERDGLCAFAEASSLEFAFKGVDSPRSVVKRRTK